MINSSPLIALAKADLISLLEKLAGSLVVPSGVAKEIGYGHQDDLARLWLTTHGSDYVVESSAIHSVVSSWDLGYGESEVLPFAHTHSGFHAVIDDRMARNCAKSLGIPFIGTIGVIVLAKKEGHLKSVGESLQELQMAGLYLDSYLVHKAIELVGE